MNESKYSKVIFSEICETYPTDADIECRFYIGDSVVATVGDKICLFRVGWTQEDHCLVMKNVSECETDAEFGEMKVRFTAAQLPKTADEFFQFCYLTKNGDICGASTPFRFQRAHEEDLIQLEANTKGSDDEDFVVVRSQQALLQERLQTLVNENGVLEYSKRSIEQQLNSKSNELSEVKRINGELEERLTLLQAKTIEGVNELKTCQVESVAKSERINDLELSLAEMKKLKNDCESRVESLDREVTSLRDELAAEKSHSLSTWEVLQSRDQEVVNLIRKTAEQQVLIDELHTNRAMAEASLEQNSVSMAKVLSERRDLDSENRLLRSQLEDKKAQCDSLQSKTELMMSEILDFDKIKLKNKVQIKTLSEDFDDMKKKVSETEDTQRSMAEEWKAREAIFVKQIDEMKRRLATAADEYQKVYKHNTRLEGKIEKIKSKVKKYFETKAQTKGAINVSLSERQELMARAETDVKTVIDSELAVDLSTSGAERSESIQLSQMPCIICNEEITCESRDSKPMIQHLEEKHSQRLCPVCATPFDLTLPGHQNYFQMHVDTHFESRYPQCSGVSAPPMSP